jgi:hypothetical protein
MESPFQSENPLVYKPDICWYGVRREEFCADGRMHINQKPCGIAAKLYKVEKNHAGVSAGERAYMYLCLQHVKKMNEVGYTLVHVPK